VSASPLHIVGSESSPVARELPQRDYVLVKLAVRDLINACGGARRASEHTRVRQPQLDRYASLDKPDELMPADVVADLEAYCGQPIVSRALAELMGFVLEPVPRAIRTGMTLGRISGQAMKETADVFARLGDMLSDGVLTKVEGRSLQSEINEAVEKLLTLKHQVREDAEREGAQ
jgi:hypothetical protein